MADHRFVIADVFTDQCFSGNQLAVLTDARGLTAGQMQDIAREFNFAETSFVLPADASRSVPVIRIFTPTSELPFAGHPTIGTAAVMAFLGHSPPADATGAVRYEEQLGSLCLRVQAARGRAVFAELEIAAPLESTPSPDLAELATAIGLARNAVHFACCGGIGLKFCFVQLQDQVSVDRAVVDRQRWKTALHAYPPQVFLFSGELESGGTLYARMLAPALGIEEDAATGSACVGLMAFLVERSALRDGTASLTIHQGVAMRRPSLLKVSALRADGRTRYVRLGGDTVIVAEGCLSFGSP